MILHNRFTLARGGFSPLWVVASSEAPRYIAPNEDLSIGSRVKQVLSIGVEAYRLSAMDANPHHARDGVATCAAATDDGNPSLRLL
ncbi:hypothetical protein ES703_17256 [subsurface metagenome]